jgi:hypothetical protein
MKLPKIVPPLSVVRLARTDRSTRAWKREIGREFRIGYYSPNDGLECVWLVNENGEYEQTTDQESLWKYFDLVSKSVERSRFGRNRAQIPPKKRDPRRSPRKATASA